MPRPILARWATRRCGSNASARSLSLAGRWTSGSCASRAVPCSTCSRSPRAPTSARRSSSPLQLHPDVKLLREYPILRSTMVKFGDVDGDGRTDFVVFGAGYPAHAFTFDGTKRWSWEAPAEGERLRAEFEAPGAVWDLDGDGKAEVIHWREIDGREWLVAADGMSGAIKHQAPWPTRAKPHVYNNFRIAIGRLAPGYPSSVVLLSDSGDSIAVAAYDARLQPLW